MLNVYFFKIRFFLSEKNFDIQLKNGTVFVTSSVEHKDQKIQSGLGAVYMAASYPANWTGPLAGTNSF